MTKAAEMEQMLNESGIEFSKYRGMTAESMEPFTRFYINGKSQAFVEVSPHTDDVILTMRCKPKQAIGLISEEVSEWVYNCGEFIDKKFGEESNYRRESNYSRLFGTPERAALTSWYMLRCKYMKCEACPIRTGCNIARDIYSDNSDATLLEWLESEAE